MARIEALSLLNQESGKEYLAELYGKVIENVRKTAISSTMKNMDLSGSPTAGSVEAKRLANAKSQDYGTARKAAEGNKVKSKPVVVTINKDKEIVEEIAEKDTRLYGVDGLLDRRSTNHVLTMAAELDTEFFKTASDNATTVEIEDGTEIADELEAIIQECENTKNDFIDGVPRALMHIVLDTKYYGKIRNDLDKNKNSNVNSADEEFNVWHGVRCDSCVNLPEGVKYILMVNGAVAQPVYANQYKAEKIPLSDDYAVSIFFHYGTEAVMPDLIFKGVYAA